MHAMQCVLCRVHIAKLSIIMHIVLVEHVQYYYMYMYLYTCIVICMCTHDLHVHVLYNTVHECEYLFNAYCCWCHYK